MEKLLTTKQVAEMFDVDVRTILYRCIPNGLKYVKVCREYRFTPKDIEEFIQNQTKQKQKVVFIDTRTEYQKKMNKKRIIV